MTPKRLSKILKAKIDVRVVLDHESLEHKIRLKRASIVLLQNEMKSTVKQIIKIRGEIDELMKLIPAPGKPLDMSNQ